MSLILDGTAGVTFPNSTVQASAGSVIQVVTNTFTTNASTSSSSFVTTGFSATITPKFATSKILVLVSGGYGANNNIGGQQMAATIYRNSTNLGGSNGLMLIYGNVAAVQAPISMSYSDTPATTSATTYTIYIASVNTAGTVNYNCSQCPSTMTIMEIAG